MFILNMCFSYIMTNFDLGGKYMHKMSQKTTKNHQKSIQKPPKTTKINPKTTKNNSKKS